MEMCEDCYFLGHYIGSSVHCRLWDRLVVLQTKCSSHMPDNLLCAICGKNPIHWLVFLESGKEDFICNECESEVRYNINYVALKMSEATLMKIHEVYAKVEMRRMNNKLLKERVESLSEKEKKTYDLLHTFSGGVLIRSLSPEQRGCLGNLVRKHLGEISSITLNYRSFKVFKLTEE